MTPDRARRLPWSGPEGKPCYVLGDSPGPLSRIADQVESVQLGAAGRLVTHAQKVLDDPEAGTDELRLLVAELAASLRDVLLIAERRGVRPRP
jgi:hypothetical protein